MKSATTGLKATPGLESFVEDNPMSEATSPSSGPSHMLFQECLHYLNEYGTQDNC